MTRIRQSSAALVVASQEFQGQAPKFASGAVDSVSASPPGKAAGGGLDGCPAQSLTDLESKPTRKVAI
jgi:hypothetical protein